MADADEDAIRRAGPPIEDNDISDEVQDFRFLASLSKDDAKIPKRGEKDFEPHQTDLQQSILDASRHAMHDALAFQRVHPPKKANIAIYHPESNRAYIDSPRSSLFKSLGTVYSPAKDPLNDIAPNANRLWLLPEEILYLVDRGTVDCRWPADTSESRTPPAAGLPMSVQAAYALFIGLAEKKHDDGLTLERYSVYSYLKRAGYHVHRAPTWAAAEADWPSDTEPSRPRQTIWSALVGLSGLEQWKYWTTYRPRPEDLARGPIVQGRRWRSYPDIYRSLALVPFHNPKTHFHAPTAKPTQQSLRITYNVWKPSNMTYRKSRPGTPDFRIAVVDARATTLPSLSEMSALLDTLPYAPPSEGMQLPARLRHGYKSVILAVVDQGVSSFIRLADAAFGLEKLYDRPVKAGGKGKWRGIKPRGQGAKT